LEILARRLVNTKGWCMLKKEGLGVEFVDQVSKSITMCVVELEEHS